MDRAGLSKPRRAFLQRLSAGLAAGYNSLDFERTASITAAAFVADNRVRLAAPSRVYEMPAASDALREFLRPGIRKAHIAF